MKRLAALVVGVVFVALPLPAQAQVLPGGQADGYMIIPTRPRVPRNFDAGFSIYSAAWPLLLRYPGNQFQSGLCGTWMSAQHAGKRPKNLYSDIEGGLGWWRGTRFPTAAPKFHLGGVAYNWHRIIDAPYSADWKHNPRAGYGVAQLSPWLLFPPDGLTLKPGTNGQLFGYGYLALPLTDPQATTNGKHVPMGNHCWTLFINTRNFKGPVCFFTPYFWNRSASTRPRLVGKLLDSRWALANKAYQMETQYLPAAVSKINNGTYARLGQVSFPADSKGRSVLLNRLMCYSRKALWGPVKIWFNGGPAVSGKLGLSQAFEQTFSPVVWSTWKLYARGIPKSQRARLPWQHFAQAFLPDPASYGFIWNKQLVRTGPYGTCALLPRFYKLLDTNKQAKWQAVHSAQVPDGTKLKAINFYGRKWRHPKPYTTPDGPNSSFKQPGPAAGPFYAHLSDGSVVTYYWYRFEDQPALLHADLSQAERDKMQTRAEMIQRLWTKNRQYLPPPTQGTLADLDPAQVVTPPKGLAIGYVPIVTRQQWAGKRMAGQQ
ncbi:MAG: hypothetical protein HKL96_03470 [Phycisphaerales bacterium]|nr:hypothetical protein [Phycisphaerales bacterium]